MFVVFALALSSLGVHPVSAQDDEVVLRVAMQDDVRALNPLLAGDGWAWNLVEYIYDSPIRLGPGGDVPEPYIAVGSANLSHDLSEIDWDDCTIGTFGFNRHEFWEDPERPEAIVFYDFEGVRWHDGERVTVRDVLFSYHAAGQMPLLTGGVNVLKDKAGRAGTNYPNDHWLYIDVAYMDGFKAALKFTLQEHYNGFFTDTLNVLLLPYHIWGTTKGGQDVDNTKIWYDAGYLPDDENAWDVEDAISWDNSQPVGSGPFKFDTWDSAGGISKITTNREHFHKTGFRYNTKARQPNIDAVLFKSYKTAEAAVLALKANDVDYIAWSIPPTFVGDLANEPNVTLTQSPEQGFFYLAYNMRKESFGYDEQMSFPYETEDDVGKAFRRAVAHCIDKEKIVQRMLLNFGVPGDGPLSPVSSWYNSSIPKYDFRPQEAIDILTNAGYQLTDGPGSEPGPGNWWLRPDGRPIGSGSGGKIEILAPQVDYDPIAASKELMIAQELQNIGIYAESVAMTDWNIINRMENRQFDMAVSSWNINSRPSQFLYSFFHSSNSVLGLNYPGYQNTSFDALIDGARQSYDWDTEKQLIKDAQAAIAYDLPYDVLYFKTNIEAYRNDRFVGWQSNLHGTIFNIMSLYEIREPGNFKLNAKFVDCPSAMFSNSTVTISVLTTDQYRTPVGGAWVWLNASAGKLSKDEGNSTGSGRLTVTYTAPHLPPTPDNLANGTTVILNIKVAEYTSPTGIIYDPAPSRIALITIFPEDVDFLSVWLTANPDIINPDIDETGEFGFTYMEVLVKLHTTASPHGDPVVGIDVYVEVTPDVPNIEPTQATTDGSGIARFKVTSTDLPDDDDTTREFLVIAQAFHPTDHKVKNGTQNVHIYIMDTNHTAETRIYFPAFELSIIAITVLMLTLAISSFRRRKR